jgi:site-specific recombinase XerD
MKKTIQFKHKGITLKITQRTQEKAGTSYTDFVINDYTSGKLKRHTRASLSEAKAKAEEICERMVSGRAHVLDIRLRDEIHRALESIEPTGLRIDAACLRFVEAYNILGNADELLSAARFWREHRPDKPLEPKPVKAAVDEYLAERKIKVSPHRLKTERNCLFIFKEAFPGRCLSEVQPSEIHDLSRLRKWAKATRNDNLCTIAALYRWAINHNWTAENPASPSNVQRDPIHGSRDIDIFFPLQARTILVSIDDDLKPLVALWLFSGLRKEEASRLSFEQIDQGLSSGSIYLKASQAKTGRPRDIPICANLRLWLDQYAKPAGPVLPEQWRGRAAEHQIQRLDDLVRHIARKAKLEWVENGCRSPRHHPPRRRLKRQTKSQRLKSVYWIQARQAEPLFEFWPHRSMYSPYARRDSELLNDPGFQP